MAGHWGHASLGVTDDCQDEIRELEEDIREARDEYTLDSRARAQAELAAAKTNRLNPVKCRKNLHEARRALREGKRERRDRD